MIAPRLLTYLQGAGVPGAAYAEPPTPLSGGFDAQILGFRLADPPPRFAGPLVLRVLRPAWVESVRREASVQNALADQGFPAPRVLVREVDSAILGGPFLVMQRLEGVLLGQTFEGLGEGRNALQLLGLVMDLPFGLRRMSRRWLETVLALHRLPLEAFAVAVAAAGEEPRRLTFDAQLDAAAEQIDASGLAGLKPGLEWLLERRPAATAGAVICHGDLHPLNILAVGDRIAGVIDWGAVAIAPPELDLGAIRTLTATVPLGVPPALKPLMRAVLRSQGDAVIRGYRRVRPVDPGRLRYFDVACCLHQLLGVGLGITAGGPPAGAFATPDGVRALTRRVRRLSGARVWLPGFAA